MVVTYELNAINFHDGRANVVLTYDSPGLDENGDPIHTGAIISFVCANTSLTRTAGVAFKRNTGAVIFTRSLLPSQSETYTGGGNIKNVEDVPSASLWSS